MCCPELEPQIRGGDWPPGTPTEKKSVSQFPTRAAIDGVKDWDAVVETRN